MTQTIGEKFLQFNLDMDASASLPDGIEVMIPQQTEQVKSFLNQFYSKYYNDKNERIFLVGINPGRYGAGLTGIPFTDPINLKEVLKIKNDLPLKHELSSRFIYDVVNAFGGPDLFFGKVYLTAVSPVGFIKNGKNINYYDSKKLTQEWESNFVRWMEEQINIGADREKCYSIGSGQNLKYLSALNKKHNFFEQIEALPHPRWVMQYRYKRRKEFVNHYVEKLSS